MNVYCVLFLQQFNLPADVQHLFTVEVLLDHSKTKDHLNCELGEILFVLLIAHEKMPGDRYLVEKEDGTSEWMGMYCGWGMSEDWG